MFPQWFMSKQSQDIGGWHGCVLELSTATFILSLSDSKQHAIGFFFDPI